ncbi:PREDICTED: smoothelin-like protein 1, partial [Galeopterus variegatus]|uniref:Smoothelin-like protein 1 n=1 Tax=Galeopterus variegatus TaxID=482537 RepID=A0ABM0S4S9_GALVR
SPGGPRPAVQRSTSFGVPNANSIKQMLLDWCRAKTRGYERTHADCPQLLDTEDMVRLREPDWKCVYTYIQEFYRCLVQKGLVKTKKS